MGQSATRQGDSCTGHGSFPPRVSTGGSGDVFINGIPAHRQGDGWSVHCNPTPTCHASTLASGSATVFVNGKALGRVGDTIACGSLVASGSSNVYSG